MRVVGSFLAVHGGLPATLLADVVAEAEGTDARVTDVLHRLSNRAFWDGTLGFSHPFLGSCHSGPSILMTCVAGWQRIANETGAITRRGVDSELAQVFGSDLSVSLALGLTTHRGYFEGDGKGCQEVERVLEMLDGVDRIVVGHTPGSSVRIACGGTLPSPCLLPLLYFAPSSTAFLSFCTTILACYAGANILNFET